MSDETALTVQPTSTPSVYELIRVATTDAGVSPEKLRALFALKQDVDAANAREQFDRAFALMASEMPRVQRDGTISKITREGIDKGSIPFATWENVDTVIRPILQRHGFSLRFTTRMAETVEIMTAVLSHVGGHSETSETRVKPDPGPGRNDTQAWGSGRSYTKRYLTLDLLNIVTVKQDDDGHAAGAITDQQVNQIEDLIAELELTAAQRAGFLKPLHAASVPEIQSFAFDAAVALLRQAKAARGKK